MQRVTNVIGAAETFFSEVMVPNKAGYKLYLRIEPQLMVMAVCVFMREVI